MRARNPILMAVFAFALSFAAGCGLPEEEDAAAAPEPAATAEMFTSAATALPRIYRCGATFCNFRQGCCNGRCTANPAARCGHPGGEGAAQ